MAAQLDFGLGGCEGGLIIDVLYCSGSGLRYMFSLGMMQTLVSVIRAHLISQSVW